MPNSDPFLRAGLTPNTDVELYQSAAASGSASGSASGTTTSSGSARGYAIIISTGVSTGAAAPPRFLPKRAGSAGGISRITGQVSGTKGAFGSILGINVTSGEAAGTKGATGSVSARTTARAMPIWGEVWTDDDDLLVLVALRAFD